MVKKKIKSAKSKKKLASSRQNVMSKSKKKLSKKTLTNKKKVLATPKGYHSVTAYLIVKGAMQAIDFYKKVFGAKVVLLFERPERIMAHAELIIGDTRMMLSDECLERNVRSPKSVGGTPVNLHLYVKNADAVFDKAIAHGATVLRAMENMFYGDRSGFIQDPFGHQWFVSTHIENVSPAQVKKRMLELFK